jgi:tetratricopeptide (TPR) repeat protein
MAYEKQKMYDQALADLDHLMKQDATNVQYLNAAADLNFNRGNYQEAVNVYQKIIARNPNNADNYYWLARAKSRMGDTEGQATAAQDAISRNTQFLADSLLLLASARHTQKRIPEAIDAYSRALASRPDKLETYRMLAELYRTQNQIDEAIKTLEEARRLNATNGEVYKDLSMFYSLAGRNDEAVAAGRSAAQLLPNDPVAHTNLCRAYYQSRKLELATGACNTALKFAPEDGESLFFLGRLNTDLNKPAEAEKFYRRAVTTLIEATNKKPNDPDAFYMLGNAYADLQQNAKAVEAYNRVLEMNPKFPRTYYNIGIIRILEKDKPGALQQYNALLALDKPLAEKLKAEIDKL